MKSHTQQDEINRYKHNKNCHTLKKVLQMLSQQNDAVQIQQLLQLALPDFSQPGYFELLQFCLKQRFISQTTLKELLDQNPLNEPAFGLFADKSCL